MQDHIWGYGLTVLGALHRLLDLEVRLHQSGEPTPLTKARLRRSFSGYLGPGVSAFRDDSINTGDNDSGSPGRWWDRAGLHRLPHPVLGADGVGRCST